MRLIYNRSLNFWNLLSNKRTITNCRSWNNIFWCQRTIYFRLCRQSFFLFPFSNCLLKGKLQDPGLPIMAKSPDLTVNNKLPKLSFLFFSAIWPIEQFIFWPCPSGGHTRRRPERPSAAGRSSAPPLSASARALWPPSVRRSWRSLRSG